MSVHICCVLRFFSIQLDTFVIIHVQMKMLDVSSCLPFPDFFLFFHDEKGLKKLYFGFKSVSAFPVPFIIFRLILSTV